MSNGSDKFGGSFANNGWKIILLEHTSGGVGYKPLVGKGKLFLFDQTFFGSANGIFQILRFFTAHVFIMKRKKEVLSYRKKIPLN